jgi:hypothetical protein
MCPGVVGCGIKYMDVNVTTVMPDGKPVRVCNSDWTSFAAFDRVAVIKGGVVDSSVTSIGEEQTMGLIQLLRRVDVDVSLTWMRNNIVSIQCFESWPQAKLQLKFPNGASVVVKPSCVINGDDYIDDVVTLHLTVLDVPSSIHDALHVVPALDLELVAALRNLPYLKELVLDVGSGTLLPQLAALNSLEVLELHHYCLRGPVPASLLEGMPNLRRLTITPVAAAAGATDPATGLCGVSGALPDVALPRRTQLSHLDLSYNQLSGQLPSSLLSLARTLALHHNQFRGSIPGFVRSQAKGVTASTIDLSNNVLEASCSGCWCLLLLVHCSTTYDLVMHTYVTAVITVYEQHVNNHPQYSLSQQPVLQALGHC